MLATVNLPSISLVTQFYLMFATSFQDLSESSMCDLSLDPVSLSDMTLEEGPLSEEPEALGASAAAPTGMTSTTTVAGQAAGGGGGPVPGEGEASVSSDTPSGYVSDGGTEVPCIPALNTARLVARMK